MTIKEAAAVWQITERRVNELCKTGRIAGAMKKGKCWFIPDDAQKPIDKRTRIGQTAPSPPGLLGKKPLPIGVSDYRDACVNYYYVDKTLLIKELLDERPKVSLFTRPRRFGKTLNMDMLRVFLKGQRRTPHVILAIKKFGSAGNSTALNKENTLSFFSPLRMLNMSHGQKPI